MERIVKDYIVTFLESNNLINDSQYGFRNNKSCLANLLLFLGTVATTVDDGNPVSVIYLDFKKVFGRVSHKRLIIKLASLGISDKLLDWIREWLKNRYQRVVINGMNSDWISVLSSVPQGPVLGPILFIIYINDLDVDIKNAIFKFADDTKLIGEVGDDKLTDILQEDLNKLMEWSKMWQMEFNTEKCKVMYFGNNNDKVPLYMGKDILKDTKEERDLGIIVRDDLKVSSQCIKAANKGNQIFGMIYRTFASKNKNIMLKLYKSLV